MGLLSKALPLIVGGKTRAQWGRRTFRELDDMFSKTSLGETRGNTPAVRGKYDTSKFEGLGGQPLDMSTEARMARARELGFNVDAPYYRNALHQPRADKSPTRSVYLTSDAAYADAFPSGRGLVPAPDSVPEGVFGIKAFLRDGAVADFRRQADADAIRAALAGDPEGLAHFERRLAATTPTGHPEWLIAADDRIHDAAKRAGFSGMRIDDWGRPSVAMFDEKDIRLPHAAFDPAKKDSSDLLASRATRMYDLAPGPPRAFAADYPAGALADDAGRLLADREGRPLNPGARVVGRSMVGGEDVAVPQAELDALAESLTGRLPQNVAARSIGGDSGRLVLDRRSGRPSNIYLAQNLTARHAPRVLGHEIGHAIDELAGRIDTRGLDRELRQLYNTLNTGQERTRHLTGPEDLLYGKTETPRELMAEAIRAYMASPNEIKTIAPKVAGRIRAAVNGHPDLARTIQFNAVPLALGLGAGGLLSRARRQAGGQADA